jgi:hypothetical protein
MPKDEQYEMLRQSAGLSSLQEPPPPKRENPWLIDVFLYPANIHGVIFLAIVVLIPLIIQLLCLLLIMFVGPLAIIAILPGSLISTVIGAYVYWFLAQCVRDSACGNLRVPDMTADTPGLWEILGQILRIVGCLVLYLIPAYVYHRFTQRTDMVFWILLGAGIFLYPMGLLGVIMFDSLNGLNPIIVVPSIFSTFFQYCGLVVFIGVIILLFIFTRRLLPVNLFSGLFLYQFIQAFVQAFEIYLALVAAHLLGRFYFKYQKKLNWEV